MALNTIPKRRSGTDEQPHNLNLGAGGGRFGNKNAAANDYSNALNNEQKKLYGSGRYREKKSNVIDPHKNAAEINRDLMGQSRGFSRTGKKVSRNKRRDQAETESRDGSQTRSLSNKRRQRIRRRGTDPKANRRFKKFIEENETLSDIYGDFIEARQKLAADLEGPKGDASFPYALAAFAIAKDSTDWLTELTIIIFIFVTLTYGIAYFLYVRKRMGFGLKFIFKKLSKAIAVGLTELIPVVNVVVPAALIMLLLTHNSHKKTVQSMVAAFKLLEDKLPIPGK